MDLLFIYVGKKRKKVSHGLGQDLDTYLRLNHGSQHWNSILKETESKIWWSKNFTVQIFWWEEKYVNFSHFIGVDLELRLNHGLQHWNSILIETELTLVSPNCIDQNPVAVCSYLTTIEILVHQIFFQKYIWKCDCILNQMYNTCINIFMQEHIRLLGLNI